MVRRIPRRSEVNVVFCINWETLCKRCIYITAIFSVLLTTFILVQDDKCKLHLNTSVFINVIDKTSATAEVQEKDVETAEIAQDTIEDATETTENESVPKNDIVVQQKFMAIASQSVNNTVNLMSASDDVPHIYTSSKSIEEIIAEIGPQMDISGTSGISREDFIYAMVNCESASSGIMGLIAGDIWDICQIKNLHEFIVSGLIACECWWANLEKSTLVANRRNLMSIKDNEGEYKYYDSYFESVEDGIRLLAEEYISQDGKYKTGGNLTKIGEVYCPDTPEWPIQVASCAKTIAETLLIKEEEE